MMRVFYDTSVLGLAYYDAKARTGVYRVVENVAVGLLCSSSVEVKFCSSIGNDRACKEYLRENGISASYEKKLFSKLRTSAADAFNCNSFWKRLFGKFIESPDRSIVYHSPYHPIPQALRKRTDIGKVLTVYDLIAVLFPEYFSEGGDHCREMLGSLTPDTSVICISESTKRDLCNLSSAVDPERVFVTQLAASGLFYPCHDLAENSRVRQTYAIPDNKSYVLSVCTLEPRKNIELLIRSFVSLVLEQHLPDLCLVLTGTKGWDFEKIFSEVEHASSLRERIVFTGYVADEDLSPLYSGALAFVYPSFYEGFGLPPLEAMQCGTPVITSNTSSLPEVVGDAGIMIDPRDGEALCQAIYDLYRNEEFRQDLADKGVKRAAEFSWQRCVDETLAVYRSATPR